MNRKRLRKRVLELIEHKGHICQPGRLDLHITIHIGTEPTKIRKVRKAVAATLRDLHEERVVRLEWTGHVLNGVSLRQPVAETA